MKKIFTKLIGVTLGLAMAVGVGVGVAANNRAATRLNAAEQTVSWTATSGGLGSGVGSGTISTGTYEWSYTRTLKSGTSYTGWTSNCIQLGKNGGVENLSLTTSAIPGTIKSVSVECSSYNGAHNVSIVVGDSTYLASTATSTWTTVSAKSGTGTAEGTITVSFTGGTRALYIKSLTVVYEQSGGGPVKLSAPDPQYDSEANKVTWENVPNASGYQVKVNEGEYQSATSPYDGDFQVGTEYTVYVKAVGDGEDYLDSDADYVTFTPEAPFVGIDYVLCTSTSDLKAGTKYIFTSGTSGSVKAMSTTSNSDNRRETPVTVDGVTHRITTTKFVLELELGGTSDAWTFQTLNYLGTDGYLASAANDKNYLRVIEDANTATISFSNGAAVVTIGPHASRNKIRYNSNNGNGLFACYESGQADVYLWKEYIALTSLEVTNSPTKLSYYDSEEFDPTGITAYEAVYSDSSRKNLQASDISWPSLTAGMTEIRGSYTENGVTVYTPTYNITVLADSLSSISLSGNMETDYLTDDSWDEGNLVVTANYASGIQTVVTNESTFAYYSDSAMNNAVATPADLGVGTKTVYVKATYSGVSNTVGYGQTVTVSVEHGTIPADPLTVDEAVAIGAELAVSAQTTKEYYIQGIVSSISENNLGAGYNNATFLLEESNGTYEFKAYRIAPDGECTNFVDFKVGSEVVIKCFIKKYSASSIQNASDASIMSISFTAPSLEGVNLNKTEMTLIVGESESLTASPAPLGAELGDVTWNSSNEEVATVASNGSVEAVGAGTATITASAGGFNATCSVRVYLGVSLDLTTDTTTTETASNTHLDWNVSNKFAMEVNKAGASTATNNYYPGTAGHSYTSTRFYGNSVVTITPNAASVVGAKIVFSATSDSYATAFNNSTFSNATHSISGSEVTVNFTDGTKPIQITIGGTCGFTSAKFLYENASAKQQVQYGCSTQSLLAYHYSKDGENPFVYSDVVLRFGGFISVDLWNQLAEECDIESFGIMYAETDDLSGDTIKQKYAAALTANSGDIDAAIASLSPVIGNSEVDLTQSKTHPGLATASQKAELGIDSGDYYMWNHREIVGDGELETWFSAVAYIRIDGEIVFLQETSKSAKQAALDLLDNDIYGDDAFGGSLYALAHLND